MYQYPYKKGEYEASRINNIAVGGIQNMAVESVTVYTPNDSWFYSHHPHITYFKGKFYAVFSNGRYNEDDCGQRVMISVSEDFYHWSDPVPLVDTIMGKVSELVLFSCGFYVHDDTLIAYYGSFEYDPSTLRGPNLRPVADQTRRDDQVIYYITTNDGVHWSDPKPMNIKSGFNFGPQALLSGRLLICGGSSHSYSDDPSGVGLFTPVSVLSGGLPSEVEMITEGSFFQTADGVIYMMQRTNTDYLWCAVSYDEGKSWTQPFKTRFSDAKAKFSFGTLPDGRYYYIGNPVPGSNRNPLVYAISEDGINFSEQYLIGNRAYTLLDKGMYKNGDYGYPSVLIKDEYIYVIYSRGKESIEVSRFKWDQ